MINCFTSRCQRILLKSDLAGEYPLYIYWPKDKSIVLYSKSITELLKDRRIPKPLSVSSEGVSFLLQSGVVPPPKTAYENIYILGIGDNAEVTSVNGKVEVNFTHTFPFFNTNRLSPDEMQPDDDLILEMLAEATISRIDPSRPSFLFHSAGKDSNTIALALAEAGWQDKITLISHKSKGAADESELSAKIAKKFGFRHQVLYEVDCLEKWHKAAISDYFENSPFPCADNVTLAYPLYACQLPELREANLIDGMGNDVYIGHIPSFLEYKRQRLSFILKHFRPALKYAKSENPLHVLGRSRSEWTGTSGFAYGDAAAIFPDARDVSLHWRALDNRSDYLDFRAAVRGTIIDQEMYTRKVRNFSDVIGANLVLPFANANLASYFAKIPEKYLFDRSGLKNKLVLRELLKSRNVLDADKLGKMGFIYDSRGFVLNNWNWVRSKIIESSLWDKKEISIITQRLYNRINGKGWGSKSSSNLLYRLFIVSSWYASHQS